jgi:hypothetical protein
MTRRRKPPKRGACAELGSGSARPLLGDQPVADAQDRASASVARKAAAVERLEADLRDRIARHAREWAKNPTAPAARRDRAMHVLAAYIDFTMAIYPPGTAPQALDDSAERLKDVLAALYAWSDGGHPPLLRRDEVRKKSKAVTWDARYRGSLIWSCVRYLAPKVGGDDPAFAEIARRAGPPISKPSVKNDYDKAKRGDRMLIRSAAPPILNDEELERAITLLRSLPRQ